MNIFSDGTENHKLVINYKRQKFSLFGVIGTVFLLMVLLIETVTRYKYLGIEFTNDLTITEDVKRV